MEGERICGPEAQNGIKHSHRESGSSRVHHSRISTCKSLSGDDFAGIEPEVER